MPWRHAMAHFVECIVLFGQIFVETLLCPEPELALPSCSAEGHGHVHGGRVRRHGTLVAAPCAEHQADPGARAR